MKYIPCPVAGLFCKTALQWCYLHHSFPLQLPCIVNKVHSTVNLSMVVHTWSMIVENEIIKFSPSVSNQSIGNIPFYTFGIYKIHLIFKQPHQLRSLKWAESQCHEYQSNEIHFGALSQFRKYRFHIGPSGNPTRTLLIQSPHYKPLGYRIPHN